MHDFQPVYLTISKKALLSNLGYTRSLTPNAEVVAIVKANGYGHGMNEVCAVFSEAGINHFGVATLAEALELRASHPQAIILLMGGANWFGGVDELIRNSLTPLIGSIQELTVLAHAAKKIRPIQPVVIHLDIDSGMGRSGLCPEDVDEFIAYYQSLEPGLIYLQGVSTHFSSSDAAHLDYTLRQLAVFSAVLERLESKLGFEVIHIANSATIMHGLYRGDNEFAQRFSRYQFWVRPGLMLYGESPLTNSKSLTPALTLAAQIVVLKWVPQDSFIGYSATFCTQRRTLLGILGCGYYEGVPLELSNQGYVLVDGLRAPIIGRVSMNLIAIDLTDIIAAVGEASIFIGKEVIVLGKSGAESISAQQWADRCNSIPWEILTSLSPTIPRAVLD